MRVRVRGLGTMSSARGLGEAPPWQRPEADIAGGPVGLVEL